MKKRGTLNIILVSIDWSIGERRINGVGEQRLMASTRTSAIAMYEYVLQKRDMCKLL